MTGQTRIFIESEGDNWFRRNRQALERFDPSTDPTMQLLRQYAVTPKTVIEVGAANGARIAAIALETGAAGTAVDPSTEAVTEGRRRYPSVTFVQAPAHDVPIQTVFEVVIVNFVLHWVDRTLLLRSVAEIDRLVADGGHLVIGDFAPAHPLRVPYHHLPDQDVFTYKQHYSELFVSSSMYREVGRTSFGHSSAVPSADAADDRAAVILLRKALQGYYAPISLAHR